MFGFIEIAQNIFSSGLGKGAGAALLLLLFLLAVNEKGGKGDD